MHEHLSTLVARGQRGRHSISLASELERLRMARERPLDRRYGRLPDGSVVQVTAPCPHCGARLYDPHDKELVAECLACGLVAYSGASTEVFR